MFNGCLYMQKICSNMNTPLVSVIVPIYNVYSYVGRCIDSLLGQSLTNIEIIVVDDGSTDGSLNVVKEICKSDTRVAIVSQENQGLSCARNAGLKLAKGEYVAFIDGDDWVDSEMLKGMYENALCYDSDVVSCRLQYENLESNKFSISGRDFTKPYLSGFDLIKDVLLGSTIQTSAVIKIYRRKWLIKHNIFFVPKLLNEDIVFTLEVACLANKISLLNKPFYHAVERSSSITRNFSIQNIDNVLLALSYQKKILLKYGIFNSFESVFEASYMRSICFIAFQAAQRTSFSSYLKLIAELKYSAVYKPCLSKEALRYLPLKLLLAIVAFQNSAVLYCVLRILNRLGWKMH